MKCNLEQPEGCSQSCWLKAAPWQPAVQELAYYHQRLLVYSLRFSSLNFHAAVSQCHAKVLVPNPKNVIHSLNCMCRSHVNLQQNKNPISFVQKKEIHYLNKAPSFLPVNTVDKKCQQLLYEIVQYYFVKVHYFWHSHSIHNF